MQPVLVPSFWKCPLPHDLHPACPPWFWYCPVGQPLQPSWPALFWYCAEGQLLHPAWPALFWYWPAPQLPHDPVPLLPAGHELQLVFALLTEQPDPELHDADVCHRSVHVLAGHASHTICAVVEHECLRFWPAEHCAHPLQTVWAC